MASDSSPAVRYPLRLPVRALLFDTAGEALSPTAVTGFTRDASSTGVGVELTMPNEECLARLASEGTQITAQLEIEMDKRVVRLDGRCTWLRALDDGTHKLLIGIEYTDTDVALGGRLLERARRSVRHPQQLWAAVALAALLATLAAAFFLRSQEAQDALADQRQALREAAERKQLLATQLQQATQTIDELRASSGSRADLLAEKESALSTLRRQFEAASKRVGSLQHALDENAAPVGLVSVPYHLERGRYWVAEGKLSLALNEFKHALELDPDSADVYLEMADVYDQLERPQEAAASYKRYLALAPDAPDADDVRAQLRELEER